MEAGLEHRKRGTARNVDMMLIVAEPYYRSLEVAARTFRLAKELEAPYIYYVTANKTVLPLRSDASNPPEYPGAEVAQRQHDSYPDIQTLVLDEPPAETFDRALKAAKDMGLEIVAVEPNDGRIEAPATTFWFGFKDDVVIRITPDDSGSRLDIRSKSRVGRSDIGANAARIRCFTGRFRD